MAELLQLPVLVPAVPTPPLEDPLPVYTSATLLPTFVPRAHDLLSTSLGNDLSKLNVPALQMKLVKAEFVGSILTGACNTWAPSAAAGCGSRDCV